MSIYLDLMERVSNGEPFYIDFGQRTMKVGKSFLIKNGEYDESQELQPYEIHDLKVVLHMIEILYRNYKYSLPSERSDSKRKKYFKALPIEELTDEQLILADARENAQAALEGYVLCAILSGDLYWDEAVMQGKWFYQSNTDPDLVILRNWIETKNN